MKKSKVTLELEKEWELQDRVIEALLLGFEKPIMEDFYIPCPRAIEKASVLSLGELCEGFIQQFDFFNAPWQGLYRLKNPISIQPRALQGLQKIFPSMDDEYNAIERAMFNSHSLMLEWQWFYLIGNVFKFRQGEKDKTQERVQAYFTLAEQEDFKKIAKFNRRYSRQYYTKKVSNTD